MVNSVLNAGGDPDAFEERLRACCKTVRKPGWKYI
jgi:hypothetical protein